MSSVSPTRQQEPRGRGVALCTAGAGSEVRAWDVVTALHTLSLNERGSERIPADRGQYVEALCLS